MKKYTIFLNRSIIKFDRLCGLIAFQKSSFSDLFRKMHEEKSIEYILNKFFPILSKDRKTTMEYKSYEIRKPNKRVNYYRETSKTYACKIYINIVFKNIKTGETLEQQFLLCNIPLMLKCCSFVINGIEKTFVSVLNRAPGCYFFYRNNSRIIQMVPLYGSKVDITLDQYDNIRYTIDGFRYVRISKLLKAMAIENRYILEDLFSHIIINDGKILISVNKDFVKNEKITIIEEVPYKEVDGSCVVCLAEEYGNIKRYERCKIKDLVKIMLEKDNKTYEKSVPSLYDIYIDRCVEKDMLIKNDSFFASCYGRQRINEKLRIIGNKNMGVDKLTVTVAIKRILNTQFFFSHLDDMDEISNKRLVCSGELILECIRKGLLFIKNSLSDRLNMIGKKQVELLFNFNVIDVQIKDLFCTSGFVQFLEQTNPLAEITHKRRLALVKNTSAKVNINIRDVNNSFYGLICPIETPEGPSIGLINSIAIFCKVDNIGFLNLPLFDGKRIRFFPSIDGKVISNDGIKRYGKFVSYRKIGNRIEIMFKKNRYTDIFPGQFASVAANCIPFFNHNDANRSLMGSNMQRQSIVCVRNDHPYVITGIERSVTNNLLYHISSGCDGIVSYVDWKYIYIESEKVIRKFTLPKYHKTNQNTCVQYYPIVKKGMIVRQGDKIALCNSQKNGVISIGQNMLVAFMPWKGFNFEDSIILSESVVRRKKFMSLYVERIVVVIDIAKDIVTSALPHVNANRVINLVNGIIEIGSYVRSRDILIGKISCNKRRLSAEENLVNELFGIKRKKETFVSSSIVVPEGVEGRVIDIKYIKIGNRTVEEFLKNENRKDKKMIRRKMIIKIACYRDIQVGDKLSGRHGNKGVVSCIVPDKDMPFTTYGRVCDIILNPLSIASRMNLGQLMEMKVGLLIFGIKIVIKSLLRMGRVKKMIDIIYALIGRRLRDKSAIEYAMELVNNIMVESNPFCKQDLKKIRSISRMIFDNEIMKPLLIENDEKVTLINPDDGCFYKNPVTFGYMYFLKLYHMVANKIHARSVGPYSLITQQPLRGKSNFGGQRVGEMEVWALEAYGAANILIEMMTVKSDDISGRKDMYNNIIKNSKSYRINRPEAFHTLVKELNALGIDVKK
ncbi:DNA-directed RNA polymerase subunit beta [Candidatus Vidania fulgoroideorum]